MEEIKKRNNSEVKKNYGSAAAYASEIEKWCYQARYWMSYQQMALAHSLQITQQYYSLMNPMNQSQTVYIIYSLIFFKTIQPHQRIAFGVNLSRIFRFAMTQQSPQTIIVQQHTIPSFFRRIAAETIDSFILFFFKLFAIYLLVEMEVM